jgi:hypothetical protein
MIILDVWSTDGCVLHQRLDSRVCPSEEDALKVRFSEEEIIGFKAAKLPDDHISVSVTNHLSNKILWLRYDNGTISLARMDSIQSMG